jgi:hypothetical protein
MRLFLVVAAVAGAGLASTAHAQAQAQAQAQAAEVKVNQLIVYGDEKCPESTETEITVCARKPEGDRFRIPKELRDGVDPHPAESWASRARSFEYVGQSGIGSCTPVGPGGNIGCFNQLVREARAERAQRDETNWNAMIEEARQKRLDQIDAQSEAIEQELKAEGK